MNATGEPYRRWTPDEDAELLRVLDDATHHGASELDALAAKMNRTVKAISQRRAMLRARQYATDEDKTRRQVWPQGHAPNDGESRQAPPKSKDKQTHSPVDEPAKREARAYPPPTKKRRWEIEVETTTGATTERKHEEVVRPARVTTAVHTPASPLVNPWRASSDCVAQFAAGLVRLGERLNSNSVDGSERALTRKAMLRQAEALELHAHALAESVRVALAD